MFLICLKDQPEGVYSVMTDDGEHVIFFFEEEDDADRYLMMLEAHDDNDLPELDIVEVDIDIATNVCEDKGYCYTVVTPDDVVVPPKNL
jgi:uncharacterized protein (DUF2344 family)